MFSTFKPVISASLLAILLLLGAEGHAASSSGLNRLGYAIQMGAFANVKNAEVTAALQKKGIEAFYFRKDNGIYAVRFGDFATKDKARAAAQRLVAERLIDGFYIASPHEIVFARPRDSGWQKPHREEITPPRPAESPRRRKTRASGRDLVRATGRGLHGNPEIWAPSPPVRRTLRGHPLPMGRRECGGRHRLQRLCAGGVQPVRPQHSADLTGSVRAAPGAEG